MAEIEKLIQQVVHFRDERDWKQFHNAKDLAMAISIEAGELMEAFLWKAPQDARKEKIAEELADVLLFALLLAHEQGLDVNEIVLNKLARNGEKYPVDKARGTAKKYNEL